MTTITVDRAVLERALEALEWASDLNAVAQNHTPLHDAIDNLRAALAQPLPDPADEYRKGFIDGQIDMRDRPDEQAEKAPHTIIKLPPLPEPNWNERVYGGHGNEITHRWFTDHQMREYARQAVCESEDAWQSRATHPPRREWQSLSEDELTALGVIHSRYQEESLETGGWFDFARAIETKLKEKNHDVL